MAASASASPVPINTAEDEISVLEKGGTVRGAYLGLTSLTIDGSLSALNLPVKQGALVQSVQKAPPPKGRYPWREHRCSIEGGQVAVGGDIIIFDRRKTVTSSEDLANDIAAKKSGDTVSIRAAQGHRQGHLRTQDGEPRSSANAPTRWKTRTRPRGKRPAPLRLGHV